MFVNVYYQIPNVWKFVFNYIQIVTWLKLLGRKGENFDVRNQYCRFISTQCTRQFFALGTLAAVSKMQYAHGKFRSFMASQKLSIFEHLEVILYKYVKVVFHFIVLCYLASVTKFGPKGPTFSLLGLAYIFQSFLRFRRFLVICNHPLGCFLTLFQKCFSFWSSVYLFSKILQK